MELTNAAYAYTKAVPTGKRSAVLMREVSERLTMMIAPIAPHMAEEMYTTMLQGEGSVHAQPWPTFDPALAVADEIELPVQINGKVRARVLVAADADNATVEAAALAAAAEHLEGKAVRKLIVVPGKIVTIVVG